MQESMSTILRQDYKTLKCDSTKGYFMYFIKEDMDKIGCDLTEEDIINMSKTQWKRFINEMTIDTAFKHLKEENIKNKTKTKHIVFKKLEMSEY